MDDLNPTTGGLSHQTTNEAPKMKLSLENISISCVLLWHKIVLPAGSPPALVDSTYGLIRPSSESTTVIHVAVNVPSRIGKRRKIGWA